MPSVFTDSSGNGYDLGITVAADWTASAAALPNGDDAVDGDGSINPTYNLNGDDFNFVDGTAWTIEVWVKRTGAAGTEIIMINTVPGSTASSAQAWLMYVDTDNNFYFSLNNTTTGQYLGPVSSATTLNAWHHFVVIKETGNVLKLYKDNTLITTDSTTSGTAQAPTSAYRLYLGTRGDGAWDISNLLIAKLAIYNAQLTTGEIQDHYLAMTA